MRTVRDSLGPHPAGLGPPLTDLLERRELGRVVTLARDLALVVDPADAVAALAAHLADPAVLAALLETAPPEVRSILDRLTWGPPVGAVPRADRVVDRDSAGSPVEWLLARGMLAVADAGHVVLPREVGLALRAGRLHRAADPAASDPTADGTAPPRAVTFDRTAEAVDASAGSAAADLLRLVDELLEAWSLAPPPVLRSGGLGVRELRRTATTLDVDDATAALVVEVAYVAGLVADDGQLGPAWAPTPLSDLWHDDEPAGRWATLARAWWASTRVPGLVGSRDDRDAVRGALSPDVDRPAALTVRAAVLAEIADLAPGLALDPASLLERLRWRRPRRSGRLHDDLVTWTLR
ncbi:MAG: DNA-binding protein, partial [Rhodoferax sp.]|nr:DNA-binding protein [Actinomycetota bacterium]